ncbi:hypothetical protein [Vibrio sp. CAU 1672]|uniref:hypothetical protein n=1 Tax=Vibrio sp. CAU 1672 TaxID=3032594 RepID=UPI0023DC1D74|nr:hypothetical protein [Vibrio sp. CAU 1672]MDF2155724.1 hypothetical protein [Vibrio sp. CAU 1672]
MKKVLLVGYSFHGYLERMSNEMKKHGYQTVLLTHDQIFAYAPFRLTVPLYYIYRCIYYSTLWSKCLNSRVYSLFSFLLSDYFYRYLMNRIPNQEFDLALFVGSRELSPKSIEKLKKNRSLGKVVLYKWDANDRFNLDKLHKYFDDVYSFQISDSVNGVKFLPNYHFVEPNVDWNRNAKYSVTAVSKFDPSRYQILSKYLADSCFKESDCFIYFQSNNASDLNHNNVFSKPLPHTSVLSHYAETKFVFDFVQKNQTGMSQRVLEALASGASVITENADALTLFADSGRVFSLEDKILAVDSNLKANANLNKYIERCYCINWISYIIEQAKQ